MKVTFKEEFDYYRAHQDEFVQKYDGRVIALKGETLIGVYDTRSEAMWDLIGKHGTKKSFFIQRVSEGKEAYTITIATPGVF